MTRLRLLAAALLVGVVAWSTPAAQDLRLPNAPGTVKFAAIGDNGTGDKAQYEVGAQLARYHGIFPFELVIMLGDNMYGSEKPEDFVLKFERPYQPLLDSGVRFFASLGNHDEPQSRFYPLWNMNGERYYSYARTHVRFFALDTTDLNRRQLAWLEQELQKSEEDWKIAYFHHPLYSSAERHGSQLDLRVALEPLFIEHGVNVVFSGHDHVYERINPQNGIHYFVSGAAGKVRRGNLGRSSITAAGYDRDQSFMLVEIGGDRLHFQAISRGGEVVDAGTIARRTRPAVATPSSSP
jgi:predicted phosphodiesterase